MSRPYLIPFTLRAKPNAWIRKILINEADITQVYVDKRTIHVTLRSTGRSWVNYNPSKTDFRFWQRYKRSAELDTKRSEEQKLEVQKQVRWDMPSPDPLAMAQLQ